MWAGTLCFAATAAPLDLKVLIGTPVLEYDAAPPAQGGRVQTTTHVQLYKAFKPTSCTTTICSTAWFAFEKPLL